MAEEFSSQHTQTFPEFLTQASISLLVSTYQAGKLIMLRQQKGVLNTHFIDIEKPMGIALQEPHLAVGTSHQLIHYYNMPDVGLKIEPLDTHNACYIPRETHITGDIDIHEMGFTDNGELWLVNTKMSCLCTVTPEHSISPQWHPAFISGYDLTDRCHLNGLAIKDGQPAYVSALGTTDTPGGWRENKAAGGMLMDIRDNKMIASGLSMPHSPRWYQGKLWVLESGAGSLATVDIETGKLTTIVELPGFTRGIDFIGRYAVIGLSQVRETAVFAGLPLTERTQERQCGVYIVDIIAKQVLGFMVFSGEVQEIFSVQILPSSFPAMLSMDDPLIRTSYSLADKALKSFSKPRPEQTLLQEANILFSQGKLDEAIIAYKKINKDFPDNSMATIHLGLAFLELKQWKNAVETLERAVQKDSGNADVHHSLGKAWAGLREWKNAIASYDAVIKIDRQHAIAHYSRALVLLNQEQYEEGWQELEWRWKVMGNKPLDCSQSQWKGEDISDKTILVHTEQANGDSIQFARFIPALAKRCKCVIVMCPEPLRLFFKSIEGVDEVRLPGQVQKESFDVFIPVISLAGVLGVTLESLHTPTSYWKIPTEVAVPSLQSDKRLKVGLVWNEDPTQRTTSKPTYDLNTFLPLITNSDITFFSLQTPVTKEELVVLKKNNIVNLESELVSYAHVGGLIEQLDLLISVENSLAHLSASLGKQTWVLLDSNSSWVWQDKGETSPWYQTVRLFRQTEVESKDTEIARLVDLLSA